MTKKTQGVLWALGCLLLLAPLFYVKHCRWPAKLHEVPADCRGQIYQEILDSPAEHRLKCAAHYYARACSAANGSDALVNSCFDLLQLAVKTREPEIVALCRQYEGSDCGTGDLAK